MDWWYDWKNYDIDNDDFSGRVPIMLILLGLICVVFNGEYDGGGQFFHIVVDVVFLDGEVDNWSWSSVCLLFAT